MLKRLLRKTQIEFRKSVRRLFWPDRYSWKGIRVAFIVSTGRTGTGFFAKIFDQYFDKVSAKHEPSPDFWNLALGRIRGQFNSKEVLKRCVKGRAEICYELNKREKDFYIESNNKLTYLISQVRECYPNCQFLHVVRDGRTYVRSAYSKTVSAPGDAEEIFFLSEKDPRRRLRALDFPSDPCFDQWNEMTRFERICWYWQKKDGMSWDALDGDQRALRIKFEDIFSPEKGWATLNQIVNFLDLKERMSLTVNFSHF